MDLEQDIYTESLTCLFVVDEVVQMRDVGTCQHGVVINDHLLFLASAWN